MTPEFIIKVLLCHPTPSIEEDPEVKKAKLAIKKKYGKLRGEMSFTEAEIQAKTEWLNSYFQNNT